jgi:hypothetical protein
VAAAEPGEAVGLGRPVFRSPALPGGTEEALLRRDSALCRLGRACVEANTPAADFVPVLTFQKPAGLPLKHKRLAARS